MELVGKSRSPATVLWSAPAIALRVRPGERPMWLRLEASESALERVREAAFEAHLPVDVVVALAVEWRLCEDVAMPAADDLLAAAAIALGEPRLAPSGDLRAWDQLLAGDGPDCDVDELPEVCLPQRLAFRTPHSLNAATLNVDSLAAAAMCDRAACRLGMTMETWLLRHAIGNESQSGCRARFDLTEHN